MAIKSEFIVYGALALGAYVLFKKFFPSSAVTSGAQVAAKLGGTTGKYGDYAVVNIGQKSETLVGDTYAKISPNDYNSLNWAQKVLLNLGIVSINRYIQ